MPDPLKPEFAADIPPLDPDQGAVPGQPVPAAALPAQGNLDADGKPPKKDRSNSSPGLFVIIAIALISTLMVALRSHERPPGMEMWTFARNHVQLYEPIINDLNEELPEAERVNINLIAGTAMLRRMLSGFSAGTPVAEVMETERGMIGQVFAGPLEDVGFVDLTDRLEEEGILETLNGPSLSPWMKEGRVFGLPHDVHPVMLAYNAEIIEAEGIDMSQIETWDDFERIMMPLRADFDGDGRFDRYPLALWPTNMMYMEAMFLQAGGGLFDPEGRPILDHPRNAMVAARCVSWTGGPNAIAAEVADFSETGNQLRIEGYSLSQPFPDWMAGIWKEQVKGLDGKYKVMPLPAWEPGGRRTSVIGGTMLGISKTTEDFEAAWEFAKQLYLSKDLAEGLFETALIVSPVREFWDEPFYDEPQPFFNDQPIGRMFIELADDVPLRGSTPFATLAQARMADAMFGLMSYAKNNDVWEPEALEPEARRLLAYAQGEVVRQIERNVFVKDVLPVSIDDLDDAEMNPVDEAMDGVGVIDAADVEEALPELAE